MKFTITNKDLKKPLSLCSIIAPVSSPMKILENIWFQDGQLVAGDGQSQISVDCEVKGSFTVPSDKLKKLCSAFSDDAELAFEVKGDKLTVKSGKSRLTIPVTAPDMFPSAKLDGQPSVVSLMQQDIKYHIKNVIHAMSVQSVQRWMNSIWFKKDAKLTVTAMANIELAVSQQAIDSLSFEFGLPSSVVGKVEKLMTSGEFELHLYENKARFLLDGIDLIVPLMEEKYKDVLRAIPKLNAPITLNKAEFMDMSARAAINASRFAGALLRIRGNELEIECKDFGAESSDVMTVDYAGPDIEFGYNILQMRNAVSSIQSEVVEMHIAENGTALFISDGGMQRNVISCMRI